MPLVAPLPSDQLPLRRITPHSLSSVGRTKSGPFFSNPARADVAERGSRWAEGHPRRKARSAPPCVWRPVTTGLRCKRRRKRLRPGRAWQKCAPCTCQCVSRSRKATLSCRTQKSAADRTFQVLAACQKAQHLGTRPRAVPCPYKFKGDPHEQLVSFPPCPVLLRRAVDRHGSHCPR